MLLNIKDEDLIGLSEKVVLITGNLAIHSHNFLHSTEVYWHDLRAH